MPQPKETTPATDMPQPAGNPSVPGEPDGEQVTQTAAVPPGKIPVRLSHRPGEDTHVWPHEIPQLRSQGLLIEDPAPSGASAKAAKPAGKDR